jgi:hypothetical protein
MWLDSFVEPDARLTGELTGGADPAASCMYRWAGQRVKADNNRYKRA